MYTKSFNWKNPRKRTPAYYFGLLRRRSDEALLESTRMGKNGRFSYIALDSDTAINSREDHVFVNGIWQRGNPLDIVKEKIRAVEEKRPGGFPLFYGGAIGYLGYDLKNVIEPKLKTNSRRDTNFWDMYMFFPRVVIGFDHLSRKIFLSARDNPSIDIGKLESVLREENSPNQDISQAELKNTSFTTNLSFKEYRKLFNRAKEYIRSGDTYQVKISIRHEFDALFDSWQAYQKLRLSNSSSYSAFLDLENTTLVSCSPEELVRLEERVAETRPIGGTYPRGASEDEDKDKDIARSFFEDEKEVAEHVMLIDLERNDLGRVCRPGSVKVAKTMMLEKYTNLMHIVTTIQGDLDYGRDSFDLIKSMFPGGTVTGCPKIRAMEIIDELEPVARGPYTGSVGFITPSDECQFNILIRTLAIDKTTEKGYVQVGGGIVADSNAEYEYQENLRKGKAIMDEINNR